MWSLWCWVFLVVNSSTRGFLLFRRGSGRPVRGCDLHLHDEKGSLKNRGQQDFLFRIGRAKSPEPFNFFFVSILIFWIYFLHVQEEFFSLVQHFSSKLPLVDLD